MSLVKQLEATTRKYHDRELRKAIVWKNYFWLKLFKRSRTLSGGRSFTWPIEMGDGEGIQWITDYSILNRIPSETITQAELDWVFGNRAVTLSKQEVSKNSGKEAIVNLLSKKMAYTTRRMQKSLSDAIWVGAGGMQPTGISTGTLTAPTAGGAIATTPAATEYAGITRGTEDVATGQACDSDNWWSNSSTDCGGALTQDKMEEAYLDVCQGSESPSLIVTDKVGFRMFYNIATPIQREPHSDVAKLGFKSISFNGIPIIWDDGCPGKNTDRRVYFFNLENGIELNWLSGWKMKREPWHKPEDQHALVTDISMGFVFAVTNPRHQIVWHTITGE